MNSFREGLTDEQVINLFRSLHEECEHRKGCVTLNTTIDIYKILANELDRELLRHLMAPELQILLAASIMDPRLHHMVQTVALAMHLVGIHFGYQLRRVQELQAMYTNAPSPTPGSPPL